MKYKDYIRFNPIVHSVKGGEPTIDFDNARVSKIEPGRVDKTKLRVLLEGTVSRGMAYIFLLDARRTNVFVSLLADKRCVGLTLNEVLNLEVTF